MRQRRRLATSGHVWLVIPWLGIVLAGSSSIRDNSFLWHVQAGHLQVLAGRVLTTDPFSLAFFGDPWRTQSWLLELIYAWLGDDLAWVGSFVGLMAGLTFAAVGVSVYQSTRSVRSTGAALIWLELIAIPYLGPRPVVVSFVLLSMLLVSLRTPSLRWSIPLLLWVWAAMHGSFALGLGLVFLDGVARHDKRRIVDLVVATGAVSVTAHGWHVWEILYRFGRSSSGLAYIGEWATPDVLSLQVLPFTALIISLFIIATRGRLPTTRLWVVVPFVVFGLSSSRAVMPAAIVLIAYLASALGRSTDRVEEPSIVASLIVVTLVLLPLSLIPETSSQLDPVRFPVTLAASLDDVPTFHDDVVGGYLIFSGGPPSRVLFDDRAELYPSEFLGPLVRVRNGTPLWEPFFAEYHIAQVLIRRTDGLTEVLERSADWFAFRSDSEFVVWRRVAP